MAKIKSPNSKYTGVSASLQFVNGEAETDDKWLIEWFKNRGYKVEEPVEKQEEKESEEKNIETKKKSGKTKATESEDNKDD